ncbi:MAG: hypothetical protein ACYDDF_07380 [Thermoplasmatota archaeon]
MGPIIGFITALVVFSLVLAALVTVTPSIQSRPQTAPIAADVSSTASDTLTVLLTTPGVPTNWSATPAGADSVRQLGLAQGWGMQTISEQKLERLEGAAIPVTANGKVDYDQAKAALGLANYDFHLRTVPAFVPTSGGYFGVEGLQYTRVAYIGSYPSGNESAASINESGILASFPLLFNNQLFSLGNGGDKFSDSGTSIDPYLLFRFSGWDRSQNATSPSTMDPYRWNVYNGSALSGFPAPPMSKEVVAVGTASSIGYGPGTNERLLSPMLDFSRAVHPVLKINEWIQGDCTVPGPICIPADYGVVEVSSSGLPGTWVDVAPTDHRWTTNGTWMNDTVDLSNCVPCKLGPVQVAFRWTADGSGQAQGWLIDQVTASDAASGITLWSNQNDMRNSYYNVLVVGSNVDQTALNTADIKYGILSWVLAGGQIIVVGSSKKADEWMEPIFGAGLAGGATGQPTTPDPTQPLLITPNQLTPSIYPDDGHAWKMNLQAQMNFEQVVGATPDTSPGFRYDLMSATQPQSYGNGTIILTSYLPYLMPGAEAKKMIANFLMYGRYASLYLDYGLPIPPGVSVGTAQRLILAPKLKSVTDPLVELSATIYVWKSG